MTNPTQETKKSARGIVKLALRRVIRFLVISTAAIAPAAFS